MSTPVLRHVKPAHPEATIPDPVHKRDLPPEGYPVVWTAHWARMLYRGDIVTVEAVHPAEPELTSPSE